MPVPVMCAVLLGATVLFAAPSSPGESSGRVTAVSAAPALRVTRIRVLPGAPGAGALFDDLRLRLPGVDVAAHGTALQPGPGDGLTVFVRLRASTAGDAWELELVTSDGRGYDRTLQMEPGWSDAERTRFAAANVAPLIEGVEAGTVPADRKAVVPPAVSVAAGVSRGAPEVIIIPGVVQVPCEDCPAAAPPSEFPDAPISAVRPWTLAIRAAPTAVIGLGEPDDRSRFAGGGGLLGATAQAPSGVLIVAEVRGLRADAQVSEGSVDASLGRARVSLGSGMVLHTGGGGGELELQAALSVEPWWVRRGGQPVDVPGRAPAIGGWGRVVGGAVWRWSATALRAGGWAEVAVSGVPSDDGLLAAGVSLEQQDGGVTTRTPVFRVGGAEVSAGVELQVAFSVGRR